MVAAALFARPFGVTARVAVAARSVTLLISRWKMDRTRRARGDPLRHVVDQPVEDEPNQQRQHQHERDPAGLADRTGQVDLDHLSRGRAVRDVPGEPTGYARAVAAVSGQRVRQVGYAKAGGVEHRTPFDGCHSTRGYRRLRRQGLSSALRAVKTRLYETCRVIAAKPVVCSRVRNAAGSTGL